MRLLVATALTACVLVGCHGSDDADDPLIGQYSLSWGPVNPSGRIFPVMITQKHDDELTLPHHVAYTLAPHQMIKIEMHYLNPTDAPAQAMAAVDVFAADPRAIRDEANILFIGTPDIT